MIATLIYAWQGCELLKVTDFPIFEVLKEFFEDLEKPKSNRIYSSGNREMKKGPVGIPTHENNYNLHFWIWDLTHNINRL